MNQSFEKTIIYFNLPGTGRGKHSKKQRQNERHEDAIAEISTMVECGCKFDPVKHPVLMVEYGSVRYRLHFDEMFQRYPPDLDAATGIVTYHIQAAYAEVEAITGAMGDALKNHFSF